MNKIKRIFELFEFTSGGVKLLLGILIFLSLWFSFEFFYNLIVFDLFYSIQSFLVVVICIYGIWVILNFSSKVRLIVGVIKRMVRGYYPFSSVDELEKFVLRNIYYVFKNLREYVRLYENLLEVIYNIEEVGIVVLDEDKNILTYNVFVERVFGVSQDCRGKKFYSLFSIITPKIEDLEENSPKEIEVVYGNVEKVLKVFLRKVRNLSLIYFIDITEIKKLEKINDLSLSIFSHELKTPLTNLSLALENIILSREFSEDIIETILSNITRISSTISNITSLSNISSKKVSINKSFFNLKDVVKKIVSQLYPSYKVKNLNVVLNYEGEEEFWGDEDKIYLVLFNVIDNAMKFSPIDEDIIINVSNKDKLKIEVSNKSSISLGDDIERVFDRFYRGKNSLYYKGSGLGLYIVKSLCDIMDFEIEISEEDNFIIVRIFEG